MSIIDGPMTTCVSRNLNMMDFKFNKAFVRVSKYEGYSFTVKRVFDVFFENRGEPTDTFVEGFFSKEVIIDSPFIYKLKILFNFPINKELQEIKLKGELYSQEFYSQYSPHGYIPLEYVFNDFGDIDEQKILPSKLSKIFINEIFEKDIPK